MVGECGEEPGGPIARYYDTVVGLLGRIVGEEQERISEAARVFADAIQQDHLIYVFGPGGHSYIVSEEMTWRAGGLAAVHPVFEPGLSVSFGGRRSSAIERMPGYAPRILDTYPITQGDVLVVCNAYGINSCTIDAALWAKDKRVRSVGITSPTFSKNVPADHPARHPSRKNLFEVVDVYVDCKMPTNDAVVSFPGYPMNVAPVSTILNAFTVNSIVARTVEELLARGVKPPVWMSGNLPGGDEANRELIARYGPRIRFL